MEPRSAPVGRGVGGDRPGSVRNRRQHYRQAVSSLAYVRLDHTNGGIIRDLSESGMAVQAVACLQAGQVVHLRFELLKPKVRIEAAGQVAWADESGQAGVHFLDLPPRMRQFVKDWVLTELFAAASELALCRAPIFGVLEDEYDGLIVSPAPVPAIRMAEPEIRRAAIDVEAEDEAAEMPVRLSWWPGDISRRSFARFVDSLIVIAAVLLFSLITVETAGIFPSWSLALGLAIVATFTFGCVYRFLCMTLTGMTVGQRLARLAAEDMYWARKTEEDTPRFR
ncbi:MAG TPA: PilZ domain-containing protein [Terriglobales bacterium]|nr:PilZ domain-containing protein [Terriglobales bacterium]